MRLVVRPADQQVGLEVRCSNPSHGPRCAKYRSVRLEVLTFGQQAPVLYLSTWLAGANRTDLPVSHAAWRPTRADVRAYIESLPAGAGDFA